MNWEFVTISGRRYKYRLPDTTTEAKLIHEMQRLNKWFGLTSQLYIGENSGTFAYSHLGIVMDMEEIKKISVRARISDSERWSATVFAMGHEQTHMYHNEHGQNRKNKKHREAHCDHISGIYIGANITSGNIWPLAVRDVAFAIGKHPDDPAYPTNEQREECAVTGMNQMVFQLGIKNSVNATGMGGNLPTQLDDYMRVGSWSKITEIMRPNRPPYQMNSQVVNRG